MARNKTPTLKKIAREMKLEAYTSGKSERTLGRGLQLMLAPNKQGWTLTMFREDTIPSNQEYKIIARSFFDGRVKHVRQPNKYAIELTTVD